MAVYAWDASGGDLIAEGVVVAGLDVGGMRAGEARRLLAERVSGPLSRPRWMGIYDGAGIHGTADEASIGTNASHGCIRKLIPEVKQLYARVPVGAPIYIE